MQFDGDILRTSFQFLKAKLKVIEKICSLFLQYLQFVETFYTIFFYNY